MEKTVHSTRYNSQSTNDAEAGDYEWTMAAGGTAHRLKLASLAAIERREVGREW